MCVFHSKYLKRNNYEKFLFVKQNYELVTSLMETYMDDLKLPILCFILTSYELGEVKILIYYVGN